MLTCPRCKGRGVSLLKKLWLAPAEPKPCMSCGTLISLPRWSIAISIAFPAAAFLMGAWLFPGISFQRDIWLTAAGGATGLMVIILFVPLVRRDT